MKESKIVLMLLFWACCIVLIPFSSEAEDNPLTGTYYGTAAITSPAALGTVDLVFYLDVTGTAIQHNTSYVDLSKTLLFPAVAPQIGGKDVGPRATGNASASIFSLTIDEFTSTMKLKEYDISSGKTIPKEIPVKRKIVLTGTKITNSGNSISGTFTETVTGMTKDPFNIAGTFILIKPVSSSVANVKDLNNDGCIDINEIRLGGSDPTVIEFSDLSYALHLYHNPLPNLKVCDPALTPPDTTGAATMAKAFGEYYDSQKKK